MFNTIYSGALCGIRAYLVCVEVDASNGLPGFQMVGSLSGEVREAKDRVRVALKNIGIRLPAMSFHVNLSPADIRKEGTAFDLPVAVGVLETLSYVRGEQTKDIFFAGELGLGGEVKPVRGILPMVLLAKEQGMKYCVVPSGNLTEALSVSGIHVMGVADLEETIAFVTAEDPLRMEMTKLQKEKVCPEDTTPEKETPDFVDLNGQILGKRAALIAAAGFHNLLMIGPPGSGKTMIARRIPGIMPPLSEQESLEVASIRSISGKLKSGANLIQERPFVDPHHSVTLKALVGGGLQARPGLVTLAHRGILFLDEMTEFNKTTLESLRQPLEERIIRVSRSVGDYEYPADFMLVAACNPCPCGFYPDRNRCHCTQPQIERYLGRISGPLLDRFDLSVETARSEYRELVDCRDNEDSASLTEKVMFARERQQHRFRGSAFRFNADMDAAMVKEACVLTSESQSMLENAFERMHLSARSYYRLLRVARTIADLRGGEVIEAEDVAEAMCFRMSGDLFRRI